MKVRLHLNRPCDRYPTIYYAVGLYTCSLNQKCIKGSWFVGIAPWEVFEFTKLGFICGKLANLVIIVLMVHWFLGVEVEHVRDFRRDKVDVVDEAITFFRANVFFRNFDIQSPSDKLLIYLTLYINLALKRLEGCRTLAVGTKAIINLGLEKVSVPGEPGFSFPGLFALPQSEDEAGSITFILPNHMMFAYSAAIEERVVAFRKEPLTNASDLLCMIFFLFCVGAEYLVKLAVWFLSHNNTKYHENNKKKLSADALARVRPHSSLGRKSKIQRKCPRGMRTH
ncbi:Actin-related protein 2/3 complex subunit 3 [Carex littledalei]|uniref:Actin-related protein 2/3 complex subunit 3 n=1 Tax=Carex littledalei TaxID=544730 RepID=A0A833QHG3_9POAL|nr:Actin-related protein 2/3 complex subunit 3 [Carex littledalei]